MRRTWTVGPYRDERGDLYPLDPGEQDREMVALGVMVSRMGGSAVVVPLRVQGKDGYTTVGLAIKYDTGNVPAVDARAEAAAEPVEEPIEEPLAEEPASDSSTSDEVLEPALAE